MNNRITVTIGSQSYTLVSDEGADYVQKIAAQVNQELEGITKGVHLSTADAAVLASVNMTDKFFKERDAADNLRRQLKDYLEEGSRLKNEISELKRELFRRDREHEKELAKLKKEGARNEKP